MPTAYKSPESSSQVRTLRVAGENLSGHCLVYADASGEMFLANGPTSQPAIGMTTHAATLGNSVQVALSGQVNGLSGLTAGAEYWLGADGELTDTCPSSGVVQSAGIALTATIFLLSLGIPVYL